MRQVLLIAFVLTTIGLCQAQDSDIKVATAAYIYGRIGGCRPLVIEASDCFKKNRS